MKVELGRCLLQERLDEAGMTIEELAQELLFKKERIVDFIENKRVMSLKIALSVADTIGCAVERLYERID
ncbi:hypothetical protein PAECIP111893_01202 [Paenibacillus plantiphilus]|uniref:HTH cro/C1-type domain-containing protein n=1 Tax=Paenibacillus plantiphilus TaxID=2905650 RepID=A0ABN8G6Z6_9BACL|nr:helix-turn-helix transcriptional regulator [Paenibacillus plantiphilus]CAH1198995.1 hypothetical protein PAECIP111893_01202 [Paenibacillus plantiphilus]